MPSLDLSAEDSFAIIDLATPTLAPHPHLVGGLGMTTRELEHWETIWDLRTTGDDLYKDIVDAYSEAASYQDRTPTVLVSPGKEHQVEDAFRFTLPPSKRPRVLPTEAKPLVKRPLDLSPFSDDWSGNTLDHKTFVENMSYLYGDMQLAEEAARERLEVDGATAVSLGILGGDDEAVFLTNQLLEDRAVIEEMVTLIQEDVQAERATLLDSFLGNIASNSLLAQMALVQEEGHITAVPMHGNALHDLDCGTEMLAIRPARRGSPNQWQRFAPAIAELEELVNTTGVTEGEIEELLVRNPQFLRGLNYTEVYHQVVLPMGDGRSLRPDVIAEPVAGDWCDIIDLKLPDKPVFVGPGDRPRLSQAIAEAASQLRQYAQWFDDRKIASRVEGKYGFQCYKPKQVVIIGRNPQEFTPTQREAARSAYPDLEIVTYDGLLEAAKHRLLF